MKATWIILTALLVSTVVGLMAWLGHEPQRRQVVSDPVDSALDLPDLPAATGEPPFRIGIIPERDIFAQRHRHKALADYLAAQLGRPVEILTVNTYRAILDDFREQKVEAAFMGSLVAVLTMDRLKARVLVKPELPGGVTTYHGVLFVPESSPVQSIDDLVGRSLAMVKTTTAGDLFAFCHLAEHRLLGRPDAPRLVMVGTHDDVVAEVMAGRVDAGAVKNLRLDAFEQAHPDARIRRIHSCLPVPNNALVLRQDVSDAMGRRLSEILLRMNESETGSRALGVFGATRFVPCMPEEYASIYQMIAGLGTEWTRLDVDGPPPSLRGNPVEATACPDVNAPSTTAPAR
jgi:phosphonate transport system substrate-binding protein